MNNNRQNIQTSKVNHFQSYSGLYLFGTVVDRTRRLVPKDNPTTEIVTYTAQTNQNTKIFIDEYAPSSYYDIGADISVPVYVKTYERKNGEAAYTLMIQHENILTRGEHF